MTRFVFAIACCLVRVLLIETTCCCLVLQKACPNLTSTLRLSKVPQRATSKVKDFYRRDVEPNHHTPKAGARSEDSKNQKQRWDGRGAESYGRHSNPLWPRTNCAPCQRHARTPGGVGRRSGVSSGPRERHDGRRAPSLRGFRPQRVRARNLKSASCCCALSRQRWICPCVLASVPCARIRTGGTPSPVGVGRHFAWKCAHVVP